MHKVFDKMPVRNEVTVSDFLNLLEVSGLKPEKFTKEYFMLKWIISMGFEWIESPYVGNEIDDKFDIVSRIGFVDKSGLKPVSFTEEIQFVWNRIFEIYVGVESPNYEMLIQDIDSHGCMALEIFECGFKSNQNALCDEDEAAENALAEEPGKFVRKCERTEQFFKDCVGRPTEMVQSNKEYTEEDVTDKMVKDSSTFNKEDVTDLLAEIEKDFAVYGDECVFGGGKVLRDGMGQACGHPSCDCLDTVITNAVIIDYTGIFKADIGIKNGYISSLGKAGNPDIMNGVSSDMIIGVNTEVIAGEGMIVTAGAMDCHVRFICPQLAYEAITSGITTLEGGGMGSSCNR